MVTLLRIPFIVQFDGSPAEGETYQPRPNAMSDQKESGEQ
jgi:hypothetical protein